MNGPAVLAMMFIVIGLIVLANDFRKWKADKEFDRHTEDALHVAAPTERENQ